jgi:hypothetical protein
VNGIVYLITAFGKGEKDNLNDAEKRAVASLIREIEAELRKGDIR